MRNLFLLTALVLSCVQLATAQNEDALGKPAPGRRWGKRRPQEGENLPEHPMGGDLMEEGGAGRRAGKRRRPKESPGDDGAGADRPGARAGGRNMLRRRVAEAEADIKLYPFGTMPAFAPLDGSPAHSPSSNAVFGALFSENMMPKDIKSFTGTLRKHFDGDIVVAIHPGLKPNLLQILRDYNAIVYEVPVTCKSDGMGCNFVGAPDMEKIPLAQLRYYLYWYWSRQYSPSSKIMIADTRDAIFQSNPFEYQRHEWGDSELVLFLESQPNKVINRCNFNSGWVRGCYGEEALQRIGHNPVSCSGVSMGSRDGIMVYAMTVARHIDPEYRLIGSGVAKETKNAVCVTKGMDQGIHNWLLYSGILNRIMNDKITVFEQGEGPVNTLGGLFGANKIIKLNMEEVGIFKKDANGKITIYNWNGKPSPVAHQFDRFSGDYFKNTQGIGILTAYDGVM